MPDQSRGRSDNGEAPLIDGPFSPFLPLLRDLPRRRTKDDRPPKMQRLGLLPQGQNDVLILSVRDELRDLAPGSHNLVLGTLPYAYVGFG